jgi:hypothetical protein
MANPRCGKQFPPVLSAGHQTVSPSNDTAHDANLERHLISGGGRPLPAHHF